MKIPHELEQKVDLSKAILNRLDAGEPLSKTLSQVRLLFTTSDDKVGAAFSDILIHGFTRIPYQPLPIVEPRYQEALMFYMNVASIQDIAKIGIYSRLRDFENGKRPLEDNTVTLSVYEMENLAQPPNFDNNDSRYTSEKKLQYSVYYSSIKQILTQIRAVIYDKVSDIWREGTREKDRIELLGLEYRLITDSLESLCSSLGNTFKSAIDNLSSDNPANWALSALACRNVEFRLSEILWQSNRDIYIMRDKTELEVKNDKEKNRLLAYIDLCARNKTSDDLKAFEEAPKLVHSVYNRSCKGKKIVGHDEAKQLVVDTFHLVELLISINELRPIYF